MAKPKRAFVCQQCGWSTARWLGRCGQCRAWNTLVEEVEREATARSSGPAPKVVKLSEVSPERGGEVRVRTGIGELDTVLGGGLVAGSLVLVGGDPGIGKSTLLLMALDRFARRGLPVLYVSGEESLQQIRLRADRLGVFGETLHLLAETDLSQIEAAIREMKPLVAVVDSVQTVASPDLGGIPGSVGQVREVAHGAMVLAKATGTSVLLVGHVTKSGEIAGPKVLEHLVDAVLYFEGDGATGLRVLRSVKNRFGASGELGLFEMVDDGLREVPDASARLLAERTADAAGTTVLCAYEGSRPVLAEIQALVGRPGVQIPARHAVGVDRQRVSMLAAVLGKSGLSLHDRDLFVNAVGGLRVDEPAADLALLLAIASSMSDRPLPSDTAVFGEVGLVGEVRGVSHGVVRLKEAARHGFRRVIAPARAAEDAPAGLEVIGVRTVREALAWVAPQRS
ncbi:MAG: DNA repair protein RadA [Myxococcales bacterium]|nr:DNA repair protein RadA [Myxococcales bacterium]